MQGAIFPQVFSAVGTPANNPTQGLATYTPFVLRRLFSGDLHHPSPSPPGFPHYKENRRRLLPPLPTLRCRSGHSSRKPVPQRLKGEEQPPAVAVGCKVEKKPTSMLSFFLSGRHPAFPPLIRRSRSYSARPAFRLSSLQRQFAPR